MKYHSKTRGWNLVAVFLAVWLSGCLVIYNNVLAAQYEEYEIKGAFLYNFINFIQWPAGIFESAESPFLLGVIGASDKVKVIQKSLAGQTIKNHPLKVVAVAVEDNSQDYQMIFIMKGVIDRKQLVRLLKKVEGQPVATIGESVDFIELGGIINFVTTNKKLKFQINPSAARAGGLIISSRLLKLAIIK